MGTKNQPRRKGSGGLWIRKQRRWNEAKGQFEIVELVQAAKEVKDPTNPSVRKWVTGTGRTAEEAQRRLDRSLERYYQQGGAIRPPKFSKPQPGQLTLGNYLLQWHQELNPARVSPQLQIKYLQNLQNHVIPELGSVPLRDLNYNQLTRLFEHTLPGKINTRGKKQGQQLLGPNARLNIYKVLNIALKVAVKRGLIDSNPLDTVDPPKYQQPKENIPQFMHLVEWLFKKLKVEDLAAYDHFLLALLGLRRGERLGLTFSNVSLTGTTPKINIRNQLARIRGQGLVIVPSTKSGKDRIVALSEPWISSLKRLKKQREVQMSNPGFQPDPQFADLVFLTPSGKPWDLNTDNEYWLEVQRKFLPNGPYMRGHSLRHVAATAMAEIGVDAEVAREILGHESEAIGYYYRRISARKQQDQVAKFGASWLQ